MTEKAKRRSVLKRIILVLMILSGFCIGMFFLLPDKNKVQVFEALGIEDSDFVKNRQLENYVVVRNTNSRKALIGDNWIISGKLFNLHETAVVKKVKLMFNFSDGVETVTLTTTLQPKNTMGKKFKEKISGHGNADFTSVEILDAE
jgi:hypothetical protein